MHPSPIYLSAKELLLEIYEGNPDFNSALLLEDHINSPSFNPDDFQNAMAIVDAISVLRTAFLPLFQGLDRENAAEETTAPVPHSAALQPFLTSFDSRSPCETIDTALAAMAPLPEDVRREISLCRLLEPVIAAVLITGAYDRAARRLARADVAVVLSLSYFTEIHSDPTYIWKAYYVLQAAPLVLFKLAKDTLNEFRASLSTEPFYVFFLRKAFKGVHKLTAMPYTVLRSLLALGEEKNTLQVQDLGARSAAALLWRSVAHGVQRSIRVAGYPLALVDAFLEQRVAALSELKTANVARLGALILEKPDYSGKKIEEYSKPTLEAVSKLVTILEASQTIDPDSVARASGGQLSSAASLVGGIGRGLQRKLEPLSAPSRKTASWPAIMVALWYGPPLILQGYHNRAKIVAWLKDNVVQTFVKFYENWVLQPLVNIVKTIRHDENLRILLTGKKSLSSDIDSLERMIVDYLQKSAPGKVDVEAVRASVREGDLTEFMKDYEGQIAKPVRNLIAGDLFRLLLIQVQKVKVDGDLVINGIDKLLKLQELVFESIAVMPTGFIVLWIIRNGQAILRRGWRGVFSRGVGRHRKAAKRSLGVIERLLIMGEEGDYGVIGELAIEQMVLGRSLRRVVPREYRNEVEEDLEGLREGIPREDRLKMVTKMWRSWGEYL